MRVVDIMHRNVVTIDGAASLAEAARVLGEHGISSVVVPGPDGPAGILTERDYVKVAATGTDPKAVIASAARACRL